MKIQLFLNDEEVEINQDIDFVLNKQFTDLSDLTSIIVDYSKTIKVPMSARNNELFNYIYKFERQIMNNTTSFCYNPSLKIPMSMFYNGDLVMEGYAVLNNVNVKDKAYEINIYGQLGRIFSEMKEKVLKNYKKASNGMFAKMTMNTNGIEASWANDNHSLDWTSSDWTDFYGFAPQLYGKSDIIDTKSFEVLDTGEIKNFVDIINSQRGISYGDTYVGDGFDYNQYGEMRTYMTRPYVYVDKLIQLVKNELDSNEYEGYTLELGDDWFNASNPYYSKMCYFPGKESIVDKGKSVGGSVVWNNSERSVYFPMNYLPSKLSEGLDDGYTYSTSGYYITIQQDGSDDIGANLTLNCDGVVVRDRITGIGDNKNFNTKGKWAYYNLNNPKRVPIRYIGVFGRDINDNEVMLHKLMLCDNTINIVEKEVRFLQYYWSHWQYTDVWNKLKKWDARIITPNSTTWVNDSAKNSYAEVTQVYNFGTVALNTNKFSFKFRCDLVDITTGKVVTENIAYSEYEPLCPFKNDKYKTPVWEDGATWSSWFRPISDMSVTSMTYRSGSRWSIYEVLGDDFNPFLWLIDYVKKFRLFFDIDYKTKTITLSSSFFDNPTYKKVDVDYSKGVIVDPLVERYRAINYGYPDNESKKGIQYKRKFDVNYGDIDISTGIDINKEVLSLTPDSDEGVFIPTLSNALTWNNLSCYWPDHIVNPIQYYNILITNKVINTLDSKGEIKYYPFYAFRDENFAQPIQYKIYRLTDDSPNQRITGKYTYLDKRYISEGLTNDWRHQEEGTDEYGTVYYMKETNFIPQFDNYITAEVEVTSTLSPVRVPARARRYNIGDQEVDDDLFVEGVEVDPGIDEDDAVPATYTNPMTHRVQNAVVMSGDDEPTTQTFLFWTTFNVPAEVYNGNVPGYIQSYSIYNRWVSYLDELYNVQAHSNKKVTCYVRMSYPEFISFKFNQFFVIDNNVFLVNKIIDFNPNSPAPVKVELIQIDDVSNLK